MVNKRKEFSIPSRISEIDVAVTSVTDFAREAGCNEDSLYSIDIAMREAIANAVKHGNRLDETKNVDISLSLVPNKLEITVRDYGEGFSLEDVPDPTNPENLLKENGRGILFMQNFLDSVEWRNHGDGGLVVIMSKSL